MSEENIGGIVPKGYRRVNEPPFLVRKEDEWVLKESNSIDEEVIRLIRMFLGKGQVESMSFWENGVINHIQFRDPVVDPGSIEPASPRIGG